MLNLINLLKKSMQTKFYFELECFYFPLNYCKPLLLVDRQPPLRRLLLVTLLMVLLLLYQEMISELMLMREMGHPLDLSHQQFLVSIFIKNNKKIIFYCFPVVIFCISYKMCIFYCKTHCNCFLIPSEFHLNVNSIHLSCRM